MQPSPYSRNVCLGSHINGFPGIQRLFPQNVLLFMVLGEGIAIYFTHNNIGWVDWLHWPQSTKAEVEKRRERKEEERVVRRRRNFIFSWVQDQPKLKKKKQKTQNTWHLAMVFPTSFSEPFSVLSWALHCCSLSSKGILLLLSHSVMSDSLQPHRL